MYKYRMASSTTYHAAPLLLNLEHAQDGSSFVLASTWCNLGLWPQPTFSEACRALARRLGTAAGLGPCDVVLDCGVGYGDQCELWVSEFGVQRVIALELSVEQVEAARLRLCEQQQRSQSLSPTIEIHAGSATAAPAEVVTAAFGCDVVLCLDCAYHFDTREKFFLTAVQMLRNGGRLGMVDMLPSEVGWGWRRLAQYAVAFVCNIPRSNLYSTQQYCETCRRAGLEVTTLETLSLRVFGPFAKNAARQRRLLAGQLRWSEWGFLHLISAMMGFIAKYRLFDAILVTAEKRLSVRSQTLCGPG